jgi:hypothetical protein
MHPQAPATDSEVAARLGDPTLVCRISRKTLFWGYLLPFLPGALGAAVLAAVLQMLLADGPRDVLGSAVFLAGGVGLLWGATALWRRTDRLRHTRVVVHAGGLAYHRDGACLTCRWDQIEQFQWRLANHFEESSLAIGGLVPVPGTKMRSLSHTSQRVTVRL